MKDLLRAGPAMTVIKLVFEVKGDYMGVSSPEIPELNLGGTDFDAVMREIPLALKWLFKMNFEMDIEIVPASPIEKLGEPVRGFTIPVATSSINAVAFAA